jgi:CheY-like chemotaxis protein
MNTVRILLVDDNVLVARLIAARLEKTGRFAVRIENIPHQAQKAHDEFQPHLWLFDVDMPGITGPELVKKLRQACGEAVPTIFLTSLISPEEAGENELVSSGNRYLAKSAPAEVIIRCIDRALAIPSAA